MSRGALYGLEIGNDLVIIAAAGEEAGQGRLLINLMIMVIICRILVMPLMMEPMLKIDGRWGWNCDSGERGILPSVQVWT